MGPVGRRKVGGDRKRAKICKQNQRKTFEARHIDQVWEDVRKLPGEVHSKAHGPGGTTDKVEHDEDTPGHGQFYCIPCSRYFQTAVALADHEKTKPHKRKVKMLLTTARPHNQRDADAAGGMGPPDNGVSLGNTPMQS